MIDSILEVSSEFYGIDDITRRTRKKEYMNARHMSMYLLWHLADLSDKEVGEILNRDRTTCLHGRHKITDQIDRYEDVRLDVERILDRLKGIAARRHEYKIARRRAAA